jgi:SAM-dependent methyltransferase
MFEKIISTFTSTNRNSRLFQALIFLAIILILLFFYRKTYAPTGIEGFSQSDRYILKEDSEIYDDFYSQIYDKLMHPIEKSEYFISKMIEMTHPNKDYSAFLDVGSGTGALVDALKKNGYKAYGIDKSKAMVEQSKTLYPDIPVKCENVQNPITYDRGSFTHIICSGKTIYELSDKQQFFKNAYFWLQGNGYLILELVDRSSINMDKIGIKNSSETNTTDTLVDFLDFSYKSSFRFDSNGKSVIHKEIFTDTVTKNIRENEKVLEIEEPNEIIKLATNTGFIIKGKASMDTPGEYIYILERLN